MYAINKHQRQRNILEICSKVIIEKLMVAQLIKKFSAFHGTRILIKFARARTWSNDPRNLRMQNRPVMKLLYSACDDNFSAAVTNRFPALTV
jgi:hypothetical protein